MGKRLVFGGILIPNIRDEDEHRTPAMAAAGRHGMEMHWHDLLFIHYPVSVESLRGLIPPGLALDTFGADAWIGIVPFRMSRVKPRAFPALPWCSAFPELNVRTYVTCGGRAGVWFFSLDAANPLAVRAARGFFHLPYFDARMSSHADGESVIYRSLRTHRGAPGAEFRAAYCPAGEVFAASPGSLEHWLTERYCLYAADGRGRILRVDIHHDPWPLQPGAAEIEMDTMTAPLGLALPGTAPLLHFARKLEVIAWLPEIAAPVRPCVK